MNTIIDNTGTSERLDRLLALNAETAARGAMFRTEAERRSYLMMRNPVDFERTFALLGGFLGTVPPAAIYLNLYITKTGSMGWLLALFVLANIVTAFAGYYLGAVTGKVVRFAEKRDWATMTVLLIFTGGLWGGASGFAGGMFIFIVGAFFGAIFGMLVGAFALPIFAILHRMLQICGFIDRRQLIPLAAGLSLIVSAFILGRLS